MGLTSVHECEMRGRKNLAAVAFSAAEFYIISFSDMWIKQSENAKHFQSKKKVSSIERYNIHAIIIIIIIIIIHSLCICHSRNFLSSKQRSEN